MQPGDASSFANSDSPSTVGDVVGRTCRTVRSNYAQLFRLLILPCFINSLAWEVPAKVGEYSKGQPLPQYFLVCFAASAVAIFFSGWQISIRKYAIIQLTVRPEGGVNEFLKQAENEPWRILLIFIPSLLAELGLLVLLGLMVISVHTTDDSRAMLALVWLSVMLLSIFPYGLIDTVNCLFAGIAATELSSITSSCLRFFRILVTAPWFIIYCCSFFAAIYLIMQIPLSIPLFLDEIPKFFSGEVKAVIEAICELIQFAVSVVENVFFTAYFSVAGSAIYNEYCLRKEGRDVARRLNVLESSTS